MTGRPAAASDVIVVGGGAAGLATALRLASRRNVTLICKAPLGSGAATAWAQGGIAAALGADDSPALHVRDTELAGGGLNEHHIVEILARDAAQRITELIALGASFDRDADGALALSQEGAHSRRRIVHAGGDATGREVLRALTEAVKSSNIRVIEAVADELLVHRGRVRGVVYSTILAGDKSLARTHLNASAVVLATGGCGHLFRYTTNPPEATGDGLAMAVQAGAELADLEFVQFHPTALAANLDPMPLITEALRGEGARLVDHAGNPLMAGRDKRGDLAPRDVVARVIFEALPVGGAFLDARHIPDLARRFPTIWAAARGAGLHPDKEPLPISPAAHYHMGGISVDAFGRSTLRGLWACGEAASTGAHGANRLASNSLLEALVFGTRVADDILAHPVRRSEKPFPVQGEILPAPLPSLRLAAIYAQLRTLMYEHVGLVRDQDGLEYALDTIRSLEDTCASLEGARGLRNALQIGRLIAEAALERRESRGSHFRRDYPMSDSSFAHRTHSRPPLIRTFAS